MSFEKNPNFVLNFLENRMKVQQSHFYRFKSFHLNVAEHQLLHGDVSIPLTPKAFEVLVLLVENGGHLVDKDELLRTVWPDSFVEETNITRTIHTLRKVLGDDGNGNKFIETVAKKGYRFVADVQEVPESAENKSESEQNLSDTKTVEFTPLNKTKGKRRFVLAATALMVVVSLVFLLSFNYRPKALPNSSMSSAMRSTTNEEAYSLYLLGKALTDKHNGKDVKKGIEYLEQAVEADPNYAIAYTRLGHAYNLMTFFGGNIAESQMKQRAALEKALELDDTIAEAHAFIGEMKLNYDWDFAGAERSLKRGIELDPNSVEARRLYALYLSSMGRHDESIGEAKITIDLEPGGVLNYKNLGQFLYFARRYDEAILVLERAIEMDKDFGTAYNWLIPSCRRNNDNDKAFEYFVRLRQRRSDSPEQIQSWKDIYAASGWLGISQKQLDEALEAERNGEDRNWIMPRLYSDLGDKEKTMKRLEIAFESNQRGWSWTVLKNDPAWDLIRSDPRFEAIVKKIGL